MQDNQHYPNRRPASYSAEGNVRQFPAPEPVNTNPYDQVNKFDLAQWNHIVADIAKPEVARAVIQVMDERDSLKALFPSIYVRARQTCIEIEKKAQQRAKRIATARKMLVGTVKMARSLSVRIHGAIATLGSFRQQRLF